MADVYPASAKPMTWSAVDAIAHLANPNDRGDAQRALLDAGAQVVPSLLEALSQAGGPTARAIIETLGLLGDLRAVSPLRRVLRRPEEDLARAAAEALGHIPHGAAVWALRDGLESDRQGVRVEAILSLALLAASEEPLLATQAEATLLAIAPDDVAPLVEALLWRLPPRARDIAFARAMRVDPRAAVAVAFSHLQRRNTAQSARDVLRRAEAVHPLIFQLTADTAADILPVLADIGNHLQVDRATRASPAQGERLAEVLRDIVTVLTNWYDPEEPDLAAVVVDAMRALGDRAVDALRDRLVSADADERPYLVSLLRELQWDPSGDAAGLQYLLTAGEWDRVAALGPIAVEPLIAELRSPDLTRREGAARALARLEWQPEDRVAGFRLAIALGRWDALPRRDAAARTLLLEAMAEERETARADPSAAGERAARRGAMVRALARFPAAEATAGLLDALRDDPSPAVREEAARALEERGREAMPLITEALASAEGAPAARSAFRCDLIHLLARRGGHARSAIRLLRRLAEADPSPLVRDAARAAVTRVEGIGARGARRRHPAPPDPGQRPPPGPSLSPRATADVGEALRSAGRATPEELVEQLDARDPARVGHAVAALVSMGRAGSPVLAPLERALLTSSLGGRRAAAQVLDRLGRRPERPEALAAYYLACGDLARCEALGAPARRVLREALPLLDWRSAGAVALSLLRLGEPLWSPALGSVIDLLERVASLPDAQVGETLRDDHRSIGGRDVSLTVSRAADRRAARDLLAALQAEAVRRR